jgi:UDP-3-O-acyl-N-acetylglucosamine deacetylase
VIARQTFQIALTPSSFVERLAPARTFLLEREAQWLREQGLGQRVSGHDLLVFGESGLVENELRFPDECARHKTLDLVGDLALGGCDIAGSVVAHRSGHALNAELCRQLLRKGAGITQRRKSA